MATHYYNSFLTSNTANTPVLAMATNDTLFVTKNGGLAALAGGSNAIEFTGTVSIFIDGTIHSAYLRGIQGSSSLLSTINIGLNGSIFSELTGILVDGSYTKIYNSGDINANLYGIYNTGIGAVITNSGNIKSKLTGISIDGSSNFITNTGEIDAGDNGVVFSYGQNRLFNTGVISSRGSAVLVQGIGTDSNVIINHGHIISAISTGVYFADPNNDIVNNSGTISSGEYSGILAYGGLTDTIKIINSGTISHGVYTSNAIFNGDSKMTILNTGRIVGSVDFGAGDDYYDGMGRGLVTSEVLGGAGLDRLFGGSDTDVFRGGGDNDDISGRAGEDKLYGDSGNDTIWGGLGDDLIYGGFNDDSLRGGDNNDTLYGDGQNDTINGDAGDDYMRGNEGNDSLLGGTGDDEMLGDNENDTMRGGSGDDDMFGGSGNDSMMGDSGDDILRGGAGNDTMSGNTGADRFVFETASNGADSIRDFTDGVDKLDVADVAYALSHITTVAGNAVIELNAAGDQVTLLGISAGMITALDLV